MKVQLFNVLPSMPPGISFLETLASNLWWSWNSDAIELFRRIDAKLWKEVGHSPQVFLNRIPQRRLEALAREEGFIQHLEDVRRAFNDEVVSPPARKLSGCANECVAYFSLEYGIHESLRIYSGGLGVLAGDHLKAASDIGIPMVAVGILYRQGQYQQYLDRDGWQQEQYVENEVNLLPVQKATASDGRPVVVTMQLPEGPLSAAVWKLMVGRVPLYLLDTNLPENVPDHREITTRLYVGDRKLRLRQELLLGVAGFKALLAIGLEPRVCHINEGHAAFLSVARVSHLMRNRGLRLEAALEVVPRTTVFTTHTPVPAGNEVFSSDLVRPHFDALRGELGLDPSMVMSWGQPPGASVSEVSMTILGLRTSQYNNGVSRLHGAVARSMWKHLWPNRPEDEVPIGHVTNGIHVPSWLSADNVSLFRRYLGPDWNLHPASPDVLQLINQIPDEELWRAHELRRTHMVRSIRERMEEQFRARNSTRAELAAARSVLDHEVLTVGFARRFATYKRATLLLKDPERFKTLLLNDDRPVQFIFAGKAHPSDDLGKQLIKQIVQFAHQAGVRRRLVFLENYNIDIARVLIQGVDVWLNTPRRPQEASGTSGMKAAVNGGIHLSILDGWWCEGYHHDCGWAIGGGETYDDQEYQDSVEAQALYNLLENEVVPRFYDRQEGSIPVAWLKMMKASIRMGLAYFSSHRMVAEYTNRFYKPASVQHEELLADNGAMAERLARHRERLTAVWPKIRIDEPVTDREVSVLHVNDRFTVRVRAHLDGLSPDEVSVEVYHGPVDSHNRIAHSLVDRMTLVKDLGNGAYEFEHEVECGHTGRYGFTCRATPAGDAWGVLMPSLVTWAEGR